MACTVNYNKNGKIKSVLNPDGTESKLFKQIAKLPHVKNLEEALEIFKNSYSKKFYSVIGEKGARKLDEIRESSFRVNNLLLAKAMKEDGKTDEVIKLTTGWEINPVDMKWRFEAQDIKFKINEVELGKEYSSKDILEGDAVDAYDNIKIIFNTNGENYFNRVEGVIVLDTFGNSDTSFSNREEVVESETEERRVYRLQPQSVRNLVHEYTHFTQWQENFGRGGSPGAIVSRATELSGIEEQDNGEVQYLKLSKALKETKNNSDINILTYALAYFRGMNVAFDMAYRRISGEVKARSVEERMGLTEQERKESLLYKELNINPEDQILLTFKSDKGTEHNSFKEALLDSSGGDIQIDFNGEPVLFVSSNTNINDVGGFINNNIKSGILSEERIIEKGESYLKVEGYDQIRQIVNEVYLKQDALQNLGANSINIFNDGRISLNDQLNKVIIDGKEFDKQELRALNFNQLKEKLSEDSAVTTSIHNALYDALNKKAQTEKLTSEETLKLKLLGLLNKMGVKVLDINEYVRKYNIKNGVDPSAEALADLANRVVAFKDGQISMQSLTEETAHFIVETWDDVEIENLLRNAHKTDSYVEFNEVYRQIYSSENPNLSEQEIENLVRREILGKELAKALQNDFSTEGKTETQISILRKIYDMFLKFFNSLAQTEQSFYTDLENLTSKVDEVLFNQDAQGFLDTSKLQTKKFRLYSLKTGVPSIDSLTEIAKAAVDTLVEQEKTLSRAKKGSQANTQELRDINKKLVDLETKFEDAIFVKAVADIIALTKKQADYVDKAITTADRKGETLTNEESIVMYNLENQTAPLLNRLSAMITDKKVKGLERFVNEIAEATKRIGVTKGRLANAKTDIYARVVDRLLKRHSLPDKTFNEDGSVKRDIRQELLNAMETAEKDTNMLHAMYGQITHARDPLLNLLGSVIGDIYVGAEQAHINRAKTFQSEMRKLGFKENDVKDFIKGRWITSLWDWDAFKKAEQEIRENTLREISQTTEDLSNKETFTKVLQSLDSAQTTKYQTTVAERLRDEKENPFNDEYYKERERQLISLGIADVTRNALRKLSVERGEIVANASIESGRPVYSLQDKYNLDHLNIRRKQMKAVFNEDGSLKVGIYEDVNGTLEVDGITYSLAKNPSEEAQVAFDMHKTDAEFLKDKSRIMEEALAPEFEAELRAITDPEEAREFFLMNTNIGFSKSFWDNLDGNKSFIDRVGDLVAQRPELEGKFRDLKHKIAKRNAILKSYRDSRNTTNTLADKMSENLKSSIILDSEHIDELSAFFRAQKEFEKVETEMDAESTPNTAYFGALSDNNITTTKDRLKFAMDNMTPSNQKKVREVNEALTNLSDNKVLTTREEKLVERATGLKPYEINKDDIEGYKVSYAEERLAPYYRAFSPTGLSETIEALDEGVITAVEAVESLKQNPDVKMSNHYSYYEKSEIEGRNPNRIDNFAGGFTQPKLYDAQGNAKYINHDFVKMFAPKTENGRIVFDENGDIIPTINEKKYELYKTVMQYRKDSLKAYNELGVHNAFLAPQISQEFVEKAVGFLKSNNKGKVLKDTWKDVTQFRADELATGAEQGGVSLFKGAGIKVIPKYYLNSLEEDALISQDLFAMLTMEAQQAELYKSRVSKFHEFSVLQDAMLSRNYPDGKKAETTSTYKIFQNYADGAMFGIREFRDARVKLPFFGEVNLVKIIDVLHRFLRTRALGYNIVIPATSWLTAEVSLMMEKYIGQYVDKSSYNLAMAESRRLMPSAVTEVLDINSKSKIAVIGEYFGIFDLNSRYENSQYNKWTRFLGKLGYISHTAANFTPLSKAMLSSLYGHRLYNGEFLDYRQFKALQDKSGKTIKTDWQALEGKSLYDYISINNETNTFAFDYDRIAQDSGVTNTEEFRKEFRNKEMAIISKIKKLVELIDGQIKPEERTKLQRDVLGRFTMTHTSWLAIATQRGFKSRHFNLQTGQEEEGTYVSLGKFMTRALNGITKDNIKSFKKAYMEADDIERANLKRLMIQAGFLQGLFLMSLGWGVFADDDENQDIYSVQLSAYLLDRVVNETSSSQFGVMGELYGKVKEPVVGLSNLKDLFTLKDIVDFEEVQRGSYKGLTHSQVYFIKNTPGFKNAFNLATAENVIDARNTYKFFNKKKQEAFILAANLIDEEDLE